MGIASHASDWPGDWDAALAALAWQVDLGATECIGDVPQDRYAAGEPAAPVQPRTVAPAADTAPPGTDTAAALAAGLAARSGDLAALRAALAGFDGCDLRRGARNLVFGEGHPRARVLVLGEAPGREDDVEGRPFSGREGQLLDRMFAAIGLSRSAPDPAAAIYVTLVLPWRPPGDRAPSEAEVALLRPFVQRHIALVDPQVVVVIGAAAALAVSDDPVASAAALEAAGRGRGVLGRALGRAVLPLPQPASLLRNPASKREVWADLLALRAFLAAGAENTTGGAHGAD